MTVHEGQAVVAIPQVDPITGQPVQPAVGSPEDQLQDGGGLRRDTTLEIEAGYYADMLAALGEESNQKQQLEGQVGELSMQLAKERREASQQEQELRLRVQELEVMQAHFQEYMNAMDQGLSNGGTMPGTAPDLRPELANKSPLDIAAGNVPGTAPALSHAQTDTMASAHSIVAGTPEDSRLASRSKEGSNYDSA